MENFITHFSETDINDVPIVSGKYASLGVMFQKLTSKGVEVPDGFATTTEAPWHFLEEIQVKTFQWATSMHARMNESDRHTRNPPKCRG